ncbi:MAG: LysM peptidoglycan-binding domain-containing protein [Proteobacteria bacterium]|nr:MAG: LysM peptidoglycan-binding domain-containing protein [Pseudomonadota bacterium]
MKILARSLGAGILALTLTACGAHRGNVQSSSWAEGGLFNAKAEGGLLRAGGGSRNLSSSDDGSSLDGEVLGVRLTNKNFDIPVVYNDEVSQWLEYFTGVGRRHFNVYLERKAKFEPVIVPKLKAAGLPQDLIYLAMIESGFSTAAHSHAGAVGPWQFIQSTGRLFGLKSDWWMDERRDPHKSTDAAVNYLSRLYSEFGDWRLACAAYNSGELKIRRAIAKLGTRDFFEIARDRKALRRETKDYVPKMMAAAIIGKNPEAFGFRTFEASNELTDFTEVRIPRAENIRTVARIAGVSKDKLMEINPSLLRCCTPPQSGPYTIRVPKGDAASAVIAAVDAGEIGRYADFRRHVVRRGESLSKIARNSGVPSEAILAMNDIRSAKGLKPGTELVIPERGGAGAMGAMVASAKVRGQAKGNRMIASVEGRPLMHTVKKGETLVAISRRYDVRVKEIRRWNSLSRAKNPRPGSRIKLYVRNENSEAI